MKMMSKKRTKRSRYRGTHTHGRGAKKKARGKGHRGGKGMSGTGKRADQKKSLVINLWGNKYFGTTIRRAGRKEKNIEVVDLGKIESRLDSLVRKGIAKENKGFFEMDFTGKKVLCTGEIKTKFKIKALAASKGAIEKVEKNGGEIEISENKRENDEKDKD